MAFGARLSRAVGERPCLIFLEGDLGAGKTTLVRGFLRERGHEGAVRSPTYTLVEPYLLDGITLYHLDLYRLVDAEELEFLGLREMLDGRAILFIEWPERGGGVLPEPDLRIRIGHLDNGRELSLHAGSAVGQALIDELKHSPI